MLELVLALAMAAVVAAYTVPAYLAHTARGHRMEAVLSLHRAAHYVAVSGSATGHPLVLPRGLDRSPGHGRTVYRLELVSAQDRGGGYEIVAVPADDGPMRGDACGTFVLDGSGTRSNRAPAAGGTVLDACWLGRAA
jgi:type IV pilus assembly protein PilE